jgi:hypothetical protein
LEGYIKPLTANLSRQLKLKIVAEWQADGGGGAMAERRCSGAIVWKFVLGPTLITQSGRYNGMM